ncbi:MAG TPA: O-antigen ligase family protein [Patescibacteria group bacterium]|nr:O-antigen ligase family protein [Patescibacteria group bacterium]
MEITLIISLIFFSFIAYYRLDLAVFLIIVLLPSYLIRFDILGIPITFLESMILLGFLVWFIKTTKLKVTGWLKHRYKRLTYPFAIEIILILISSFIALFVAKLDNAALGIFKAYFFEPIALYILILNVLPGKRGREKIILALTVGALSTSLLALYQQLTGLFIFNEFWANLENRRVVSWFGYPNAVGLYLAPIILILTSYLKAISKNKGLVYRLKQILVFTTIILSVLSIYFAKSEGALIALLVAFVIFIFFSFKWAKIVVPIIILIATATILLTQPLKSYVIDKISLNDLSGEIRKQQWRETMHTLEGSSFIFGNGLSKYPVAVAPFHQEGIFFNRDKIDNFHSVLYGDAKLRAKYWQPVEIYLYPHNIFLNFWTEIGIFGMLLFTWLIAKFLLKSFNVYKRDKNILGLGLFSAMIALLIHGLVDVPYFKNDLSALFFIIIALLASILLDNKIKDKKITK